MPEKTLHEQAQVFVGRKRSQGQMSLGQAFAEQRFTEDLAQNKEDDRRMGKRDVIVQQTQAVFSRRGKLKLVTYPRLVADHKPSRHFTGKGGEVTRVDPKGYVPPVVETRETETLLPKGQNFVRVKQPTVADVIRDGEKGVWTFRKAERRVLSTTPRDFTRYVRDRAAVQMLASKESLKAQRAWLAAGNNKFTFIPPAICTAMRDIVLTYGAWKKFKESDGVTLRRWVSEGKLISHARAEHPNFNGKEPATRITGVVSPKESARKFAATVAKEGTPAYKKAFHAKFTELNAKRRSRDVSDEVKQRFESRR